VKPGAKPVVATHPIDLKPRRGLFILLGVLMLLWIAALVTLYFKTVHGRAIPQATDSASRG
jgi:hypothetical protein